MFNQNPKAPYSTSTVSFWGLAVGYLGTYMLWSNMKMLARATHKPFVIASSSEMYIMMIPNLKY